jgi:hypothetical protein
MRLPALYLKKIETINEVKTVILFKTSLLYESLLQKIKKLPSHHHLKAPSFLNITNASHPAA